MGRHKHLLDRTEYSRGGTEHMTDCSYTPRKHRTHRKSQPVTYQEFEGLQKEEISPAAQWGIPGAQPHPVTAYTQFANPGAPVYFQPHQGNEQPVPIVQIPVNAAPVPPHPMRREEATSVAETSEVSSSTQEVPREPGHRHSSVRRRHSRTSSSQRRRSGQR